MVTLTLHVPLLPAVIEPLRRAQFPETLQDFFPLEAVTVNAVTETFWPLCRLETFHVTFVAAAMAVAPGTMPTSDSTSTRAVLRTVACIPAH